MSTDVSRAVVLSFVENFTAGRVDAALSLFADDATWWVAGTSGQFGLAGLRTMAQLPELFQWLGGAMPNGVQTTVRGVTAEGERVALEVEARATTASGAAYHNFLHFLFEVRAGKIIAVREYLDTLHAQKTLVESAGTAGV
jgi:uncharacterized protein